MKSRKRITKKTPYHEYRNPLGTRYASAAMSWIFSEQHRAEVWRNLWIYLADEERKLGLPIKASQIKALEKAKTDIDFDRVREFEKELKHDVMSHLKAFAEKAPSAEPVMHLGATSCYITDNADAILLKEATEHLRKKIECILFVLGKKIKKYASLEMTGFTHFQSAQPVTLGKRLALWAQDLLWDLEEFDFVLSRLRPRGVKGTTGTQASFLTLFKGDYTKVKKLDRAVAKRMGFAESVPLSAQTLSRKMDTWFLSALANFASTISKISYDARLLQHLEEVSEPFGKKQVGSSAMAYKKNPMLAERMTGLARFLISLSHNGPWTYGTQWLERSLDDSSNRRLVIPESFLTADALCEILYRYVDGLVVNEDKINARLQENAAKFETETYMMEGTLKGASRQELHEVVRKASLRGDLAASRDKKPLSGAAAHQAVHFYEQAVHPRVRRSASSMKTLFETPKI